MISAGLFQPHGGHSLPKSFKTVQVIEAQWGRHFTAGVQPQWGASFGLEAAPLLVLSRCWAK